MKQFLGIFALSVVLCYFFVAIVAALIIENFFLLIIFVALIVSVLGTVLVRQTTKIADLETRIETLENPSDDEE